MGNYCRNILFTRRRINGRFGSELIIKVGHIILPLELRQEGGRHPPVQHLVPLDSGEEPVLLHGDAVPLTRAQSLLHRSVEKPLDDVLGIGCEVVLELQLPPEHPLRDGLPVVASEGRRAGQHVVNENSEAPPVHLLAMPTVENKQHEIST